MGKIITGYEDFTNAQILTRATAGLCTMTNMTTYVDCTDITITGIKSAIGESVTSLGALCVSALVNKWSWFSSREWLVAGGALYDTPRTPYTMGGFAGYNHSAVGPFAYNNSLDPATINEAETTEVTVTVTLNLGEIRWAGTGSANIRYIGINSKIDGASQGISYVTFTEDSNHIQILTNVFNATLSAARNVDNYLFFADADYIKICDIPNISVVSLGMSVNLRAYTGDISFSAFLQSHNTGWQFGMTDPTEVTQSDIANGTYNLTFTPVIDANNSYSNVTYTFALYAQLNGGGFVDCSKSVVFDGSGSNVNVTDTLPFDIDYGDVVDFRLS